MPDLGDELRRWADQAEPITADDARRRAAGDDGRGSAPRRRAWLAVAAVALLLVGIGALAAVRSDDDDGRDDVRTVPSPTTTTATDPSPSTPSSTTLVPPPDVAIPPSFFVAHDAEHRLVVVDAATGETTRVLDTFDDPDAAVPEGEPAGMGRYLGRFALSGFTVYYETCCEPAVGEIFRVPVGGGDPERVTTGTDPAVSPDGTRLAVVMLQSLKVVDLQTGEEQVYPIADNSPVVALGHPAWSPDGTQLAIERYDESVDSGRVVLVTFDGAEDVLNAAATVTEADEVGTPMLPTFDPEGHLLVVRQRLDAERQPQDPAQVELYVVDSYPQFGSVVMRPQGVRAQGSSSGTGHVILLRTDGRTEVTRADGSTSLLETDLLDVAW